MLAETCSPPDATIVGQIPLYISAYFDRASAGLRFEWVGVGYGTLHINRFQGRLPPPLAACRGPADRWILGPSVVPALPSTVGTSG